MKRLIFVTIWLVGSLTGCGPDPQPTFKFSYMVTNDAGFNVRLTCDKCETVTISNGQSMVIKTNSPFSDYSLSATTATTKKLEAQESGTNNFTIWSYDYDIIYTVAGTASAVDVTYKDASGQTVEKLNQVPPFPIQYYFRDFAGHEVSISAKNKSNSGFVRVIIYYKGKLLVEQQSNTAYGAATTSASI